MNSQIKISRLYGISENNLSRISADVEGIPVWFESSDTSLTPSPEGLVSAFLVPALELKGDLHIEGNLNPQYLSNTRQIMTQFSKWWEYPRISIYQDKSPALAPRERTKKALLFTCGVDSFFTLLRSKQKIDYLVYIHGYDIPLRDFRRIDMLKNSLRSVAHEMNIKLIIIKTNLKEHPISLKAGWERAHGGALSAIGHILSDVATLIISSSNPYSHAYPWGSHWKTDHLWSSDTVKIFQFGAELWRNEKLRLIADEALVQRYVRVCTRRENWKLNCGQCEKCLRTMLILTVCKKLDDFVAFGDKKNLAHKVDSLDFFDPYLLPIYEAFLDKGLPRDLEKTIKALIRRTKKERFISMPSVKGVYGYLRPFIPSAMRKKIIKVFLSHRAENGLYPY